MASAQATQKAMRVGYRTVDGVRIRYSESDGPAVRTVVLQSVARECLCVGCGGTAVPIALGEPLQSWVLDPDVERFRSVDSAAIVTTALDTVAGHAFPNAIREDYLESYAGDRFFQSMRYARRYPAELPALAELLPEIEIPVLIFAGLRDRVVPLANAEFLTARIPRSRLATSDCGHFVWEEASDEFAALIAAWVTGGYRQCNAIAN